MKQDDLKQLAKLAELRADRSAARLAKIQGLIDTLEAKATALREARPEAPGSIPEAVMRDRWNRWRAQQVAMLNTQIARLQVVAQPQRELHARDRARTMVLEKVREEVRAKSRR